MDTDQKTSQQNSLSYEIPIADLYTYLIFENEISIADFLHDVMEGYAKLIKFTGSFMVDIHTTILSITIHFSNEEDLMYFQLRFDKEEFRDVFKGLYHARQNPIH